MRRACRWGGAGKRGPTLLEGAPVSSPDRRRSRRLVRGLFGRGRIRRRRSRLCRARIRRRRLCGRGRLRRLRLRRDIRRRRLRRDRRGIRPRRRLGLRRARRFLQRNSEQGRSPLDPGPIELGGIANRHAPHLALGAGVHDGVFRPSVRRPAQLPSPAVLVARDPGVAGQQTVDGAQELVDVPERAPASRATSPWAPAATTFEAQAGIRFDSVEDEGTARLPG